MNQDLLSKAKELQKKGYSIRQIAAELAISKSQVFRWLNGQSGNGGNASPIDLIAKTTNTKHGLEMLKLAQQDKELELRKREIELRHLEKDALARQLQMEERKINHGLKIWIKKERALLSDFDYEEIEMDLATFKRHHKVLAKLWEQIKQHMAAYGIDTESHLGHYYLKSLMEILDEVLENALEKQDEDDEDSDIIVSYEYDDDSIEFLE